jgi:hypothetical protein
LVLSAFFSAFFASLAQRVVNIKELVMKKYIVLFVAAAIVYLPGSALAQRQVELIPSISVSETYDDNINLTRTNEQSDYITAVTPSLALNVLTQNTRLGMTYAPSFVWYADFDGNNNTRHLGTVGWEQQLTRYLDFTLTDTYLNSEDPLEDETDLRAERTTRNKYWVNTARAEMGYVFGAESRLGVGYGRADRENDDITLDDSKVQTPFANLTHWFNIRHGMALNYTYTDAQFTREGGGTADDDYTGHGAGVRYIHRFNPRTSAYVDYGYTTRDFEGIEEDYDIHNGSIGFDHAFSPQYSLSAGAGYFIRVNDISENQDGPTFNLALTRTFARGTITIGGDGGWGEEYLDRDGTGFTKYYGGFARVTYQVLEQVGIYAGASYRQDKDDLDVQSKFFRGNCGVRWSFMRWFSLALDYTYADRSDDIEINSYKNNRVMLVLSASKPYRF